MPEYQSPGGAFSSAFEDTLLKQEAGKRQQMLDALAQQKGRRDEQRLQIQDQRAQAAEQRQQELASLAERKMIEERLEHAINTKKADRKEFLADYHDRYVPGDYELPEDTQRAKELDVAHLAIPAGPLGRPAVEPSGPVAPGGPALEPPTRVVQGTQQQRANVRFGQMGPTATLPEMQTTAHQAGLPDTAAEKAYGMAHPELKEKPAKPEADKDKYLQIQTDLKLGKPVPPEAKAWAAAYEQDKKLTVDTSGANAAARQGESERITNTRLDKTEKFAKQQAGRAILSNKVDEPWEAAKSKAALLKGIVALAQGGNMTAGAIQSLVGTMTTLTAEGIKRINTPEIATFQSAGSLLRKTQNEIGALKEGQPLSDGAQQDLLKIADALTKNAHDEYASKFKEIKTRYELDDEKMKPLPEGDEPGAPEKPSVQNLRKKYNY